MEGTKKKQAPVPAPRPSRRPRRILQSLREGWLKWRTNLDDLNAAPIYEDIWCVLNNGVLWLYRKPHDPGQEVAVLPLHDAVLCEHPEMIHPEALPQLGFALRCRVSDQRLQLKAVSVKERAVWLSALTSFTKPQNRQLFSFMGERDCNNDTAYHTLPLRTNLFKSAQSDNRIVKRVSLVPQSNNQVKRQDTLRELVKRTRDTATTLCWSQLPEVASSKVFGKLNSQEVRLESLRFSLVTSEVLYNQELTDLVHLTKRSVSWCNSLPAYTRRTIASVVEKVKKCSDNVVYDLEQIWQRTVTFDGIYVILQKNMEKFDVFITYCSHLQELLEVLNAAIKQKADLNNLFFSSLFNLERVYLPLFRLKSICMLLEEMRLILIASSCHLEHFHCNRTLAQITEVVDECHKALSSTTGSEFTETLRSKLQGCCESSVQIKFPELSKESKTSKADAAIKLHIDNRSSIQNGEEHNQLSNKNSAIISIKEEKVPTILSNFKSSSASQTPSEERQTSVISCNHDSAKSLSSQQKKKTPTPSFNSSSANKSFLHERACNTFSNITNGYRSSMPNEEMDSSSSVCRSYLQDDQSNLKEKCQIFQEYADHNMSNHNNDGENPEVQCASKFPVLSLNTNSYPLYYEINYGQTNMVEDGVKDSIPHSSSQEEKINFVSSQNKEDMHDLYEIPTECQNLMTVMHGTTDSEQTSVQSMNKNPLIFSNKRVTTSEASSMDAVIYGKINHSKNLPGKSYINKNENSQDEKQTMIYSKEVSPKVPSKFALYEHIWFDTPSDNCVYDEVYNVHTKAEDETLNVNKVVSSESSKENDFYDDILYVTHCGNDMYEEVNNLCTNPIGETQSSYEIKVANYEVLSEESELVEAVNAVCNSIVNPNNTHSNKHPEPKHVLINSESSDDGTYEEITFVNVNKHIGKDLSLIAEPKSTDVVGSEFTICDIYDDIGNFDEVLTESHIPSLVVEPKSTDVESSEFTVPKSYDDIGNISKHSEEILQDSGISSLITELKSESTVPMIYDDIGNVHKHCEEMLKDSDISSLETEPKSTDAMNTVSTVSEIYDDIGNICKHSKDMLQDSCVSSQTTGKGTYTSEPLHSNRTEVLVITKGDQLVVPNTADQSSTVFKSCAELNLIPHPKKNTQMMEMLLCDNKSPVDIVKSVNCEKPVEDVATCGGIPHPNSDVDYLDITKASSVINMKSQTMHSEPEYASDDFEHGPEGQLQRSPSMSSLNLLNMTKWSRSMKSMVTSEIVRHKVDPVAVLQSPFNDAPLYQEYCMVIPPQLIDDGTNFRMSSDDSSYVSAESMDHEYEPLNEYLVSQHFIVEAQTFNEKNNILRADNRRAQWCETVEVMRSGLLDHMSLNEKKLQEAKFEIITSEVSFYKSITILDKYFVNSPELMNPEVLMDEDRRKLFISVEPVLSISESFLKDLVRVWEQDLMLSKLPEIISGYTKGRFRVYIAYCSNQVITNIVLAHLRERNRRFVEVVEKIEANPSCQMFTLQSFLTQPMQRITRLPILVEAILKHLSHDSDEYAVWKELYMTLQMVVNECNEAVRRSERKSAEKRVGEPSIIKYLWKSRFQLSNMAHSFPHFSCHARNNNWILHTATA